MELFPSRPLTMLLRGYFLYGGVPLDEENENQEEDTSYEDRDAGYDMIQVARGSPCRNCEKLTLCRKHTPP